MKFFINFTNKICFKTCLHTLDAVDQKLYAVGGKEIGVDVARSVEVYDPISNQWSDVLIDALDAIHVPSGASSFVHGRLIFLFGGGKSPHSAVFHADGSNIFEYIDKLPIDYARNVSALLTLPKLL